MPRKTLKSARAAYTRAIASMRPRPDAAENKPSHWCSTGMRKLQ